MALASNLGSTVIQDPGAKVGRRAGGRVPASLSGKVAASTGARRALAALRNNAMASAMQDQRALNALARIERAVARIEGAAAARGKVDLAGRDELEALRTAHGRLRGRVERAIAELDALIAEREEAAH